MKKKTIAIDFDDTLTADPVLWAEFIRLAKARGFRCICVTARRETLANALQINSLLDQHGCQMPVFYTALASKLAFMRNCGIEVDIWCDDNPIAIVNGF